MASSAIYSVTKLYYSTGSAASGSEVIGITDINGPSLSKGEIDVSNMDSVGFRDFKPSYLGDPGTVSFDCQWVPTNTVHKALANRIGNTGSLVDLWRMTFSDGTNYDFSGSVQELSIKATNPADGVLMASCKVRLTGAIVLP